jgi:hypothetical protein
VKRLPLIALVALSAVVWTGSAQAKELSSFKACGAAGCKAVTARTTLRALIKALELQGEPVTTDTPAPAPFFRLEFTAKGDEGMSPSFTQYYIPAGGVIAIHPEAGSWAWIDAASLRSLYRKVTAGLTPYGTPTFTRAALGGDALAGPASYSRLFRLHGSTDDQPAEADWIAITLGAAAPSPWTTEAATLEYSPSTNVLWRGVEYVKLPGPLADNLEHNRTFAAPASDGGFPWAPLLGALGSAALLLGGAFLARRRRGERVPVTGPTTLPE